MINFSDAANTLRQVADLLDAFGAFFTSASQTPPVVEPQPLPTDGANTSTTGAS